MYIKISYKFHRIPDRQSRFITKVHVYWDNPRTFDRIRASCLGHIEMSLTTPAVEISISGMGGYLLNILSGSRCIRDAVPFNNHYSRLSGNLIENILPVYAASPFLKTDICLVHQQINILEH